jgi:outer membrane protein assembly factor BamA
MHLALAVLLSAAAAAADTDLPDSQAPRAEKASYHGIDWLAIPLLSFDADDLIGFGVGGNLQWQGDVRPYRHQLMFQLFWSTALVQRHIAAYDSPQFLGTPLRFWARVEYRAESLMPYYGLGNFSSASVADHPELDPEHAFVYERRVASARTGCSFPIAAPVYAFSFLTVKSARVATYDDSLLNAERPRGIEGGTDFQGDVGLYIDRRDSEATPTRGWRLELSARGIGPLSSHGFWGANGYETHFVPLADGLVLGSRLEVDYLSEKAPFYELASFGGITPIEGVGGQYSARGIPKTRYIGRLKALENIELRSRVFDLVLMKEKISFGTAAFVDLGRVWQLDGHDGSPWSIHFGWGGGVRAWLRSFVVRADVGFSPERAFSFYALFGHFF